jgi:hypothetical protein
VAKTFLSAIDLAKNELQNARIQNLGSAPSSPALGQIYFDTAGSANLFKYWNGTAWIAAPRLDQIPAPTAALAMNSQQITGLADPSGAQHAATQNYVLGRKITDLTAPTTAVAFNSQQLTGVADPSAAQHAATQNYVLGRKVTDLTAPTAAFSMNSQKITNLATPTTAGDAAEYSWVATQVENARQGVSYKMPVKVAATTNVNLAAPGATIDGVTMATSDRFLATNQTTTADKGIYVWNGAASAATRAADADVFGELQDGTQVYVAAGTDAEKVYRQTATISSFTGQVWGISAAGGTYVAGAGLTETAGTFDVIAAASGGITVNADSIQVDPAVVARKFTALIGDTSATSFTLTHNLNTRYCHVTVRDASTWKEVIVDNDTATSVNQAVIGPFTTAPGTNAYAVAIMG